LQKAQAIRGYDVVKSNNSIKLRLRSLVTQGILVQIKGSSASGPFKLNKARKETKEKAQKKKPVAKP
ncbi:Histone H1.01, partial [Chelonia mydas]